jgi:hypothetical protein
MENAMPNASPEDEARFYRMVHELVHGTADDEPRSESRRSRREPYPRRQLIAPGVGLRRPRLEEFREERCFDLSASGFSFLAAHPPDYRTLVVALGNPPDLTYLSAEVAHVTPLSLVGCRFTGRIE